MLGFILLILAVDGEITITFGPQENGGPKEVILEVLKSAKRIDLALYELKDVDLAQSLVNARERGTSVRILLDRGRHEALEDATDDLSMKIADLVNRLRLRGTLVPVSASRLRKSLKLPPPTRTGGYRNALFHHTLMIADDAVITGSFSWTPQAAQSNFENLIVIRHREFAAQVRVEFEKWWGAANRKK